MRRNRMATLAASGVALLLTAASTVPANAATSGVGTSRTSTSFLDVALGNNGSLLNLSLLSDKGIANIDPKVGAASAGSDLSPLRLSSSVIPALNVTVPGFKSSSTGAEQKTTSPDVPLATPLTSGTLQGLNMSSVVDDKGAVAGIDLGLKNFGVVAGLLTIPNMSLDLAAKALKTDANGFRGIQVDRVDALNLANLLQMLGINPSLLNLADVSKLLDVLKVQVPNGTELLNGTELTSLVTGLVTQIGELAPAPAGAVLSQVSPTLDETLNTLLGAVGSTVQVVDTTAVTAAIDTLQATLRALLTSVLNALNKPLLSLTGINVGLKTIAADTLDKSVADVVASIGAIKVGDLALPGLNPGQVLNQVSGVVNTVNGTLNGALSQIGLGNLVNVGLFNQEKKVNSSGGYNHALASLSALSLKITPPAALQSLINGLGGAGSIGGILTGVAGVPAAQVPVVGGQGQAANSALGGANILGALAQGASADLVKVQSASDFAIVSAPGSTPSAPVVVGELPQTGSEHLVFVLGLLFLATGAGLGTWMRHARNNA